MQDIIAGAKLAKEQIGKYSKLQMLKLANEQGIFIMAEKEPTFEE